MRLAKLEFIVYFLCFRSIMAQLRVEKKPLHVPPLEEIANSTPVNCLTFTFFNSVFFSAKFQFDL